jgi:hypothetical protein
MFENLWVYIMIGTDVSCVKGGPPFQPGISYRCAMCDAMNENDKEMINHDCSFLFGYHYSSGICFRPNNNLFVPSINDQEVMTSIVKLEQLYKMRPSQYHESFINKK